MYLYGAGGHAKVVIDILKINNVPIMGLFDDNPNVTSLLGFPVQNEYKEQSPIIISIGDCNIRKKIANKIVCDYGCAIHPDSIISDSVTIGKGSVIMAGAIIEVDTKIGKHGIINTGTNINHECEISDFVHIAPGCNICGNVQIGECTLIGVGSSIIPGIKIGKNVTIGAGSVVVNDIPDNSVAFGNPCVVKSFKTTESQ